MRTSWIRRSIMVNCEKIMIFSVLLLRCSMAFTSSITLRIFAESLSEVSTFLVITSQELQWIPLGFARLGATLAMTLTSEDRTYLTKQIWHFDAALRFMLLRAFAKSFPSSSSSWVGSSSRLITASSSTFQSPLTKEGWLHAGFSQLTFDREQVDQSYLPWRRRRSIVNTCMYARLSFVL